jgi:hypothetical protein
MITVILYRLVYVLHIPIPAKDSVSGLCVFGASLLTLEEKAGKHDPQEIETTDVHQTQSHDDP